MEKTMAQNVEENEVKVEGFYQCENKEEDCLTDCPFSTSIWTTSH